MRKFFLFLLFIIFVFCSFSYSIVLADNRQTVTVVYLERIGDTPFAKRVATTINIPVYENHTIKVADVAAKIGNCAYGVMCSYCDKYNYVVDGDYYLAEYHKSVYLNCITDDAHVEHYFLDVNNSYYDYYGQFVLGSVSLSSGDNNYSPVALASSHGGSSSDDGYFHSDDSNQGTSVLSILPASLYDYYLNLIHVKYPQLNGLYADEIYGYWGWVAIPHSNSINDILTSRVFSLPVTFDGVLDQIKYEESLSREAYESLMNDYNYSWYLTLWSEVLATFGAGTNKLADFFMFYGDGKTLKAFLAENGATNADDTQISSFSIAEDVINNVGDFFNEVLNGSDKIFMILGGVIGVIIVFFVLKAIFSLKLLSGKFKNGKDNDKKKK